MKKFITLALAAGLFANGQLQAQEAFSVDGIDYVATGENTAGVTGADKQLTAVTIPENVTNGGKAYTVTSIEEKAFYWSDVQKIVMPSTIVELKASAIYSNDYLTEIVVSENLKKLSNFCLAYNPELTSITLPEGITEIPNSCFANNPKLTEINLPTTITTIGNGAFYKTGASSFTVPENCTSIGSNAFQLAPNLSEVVCNSNLEVLGDGTFRQCASLTDINLEAATKLKAIPENLFVECSSLQTITIPESVESIGIAAFGNTGITEFNIDPDNSHFTKVGKAIYSSDKQLIYAYPPKSGDTAYKIEDGCRGINGGAFYGSDLQKVTLPNSMIAIDAFAFCESQLAEIIFPSEMVLIGEQAFAGTQLTTLTLPEGITFISDGLGAWSKKLTTVTIPSTVRTVYNHAFQSCSALTDVHFKGAKAPYIYDYYDEEDNPFGYIDRSAVEIHIPAGSLASYEEELWNQLFSTLIESEPAALVPVSIIPADGAEIASVSSIDITFPEEVAIVAANPAVTVRKDSELAGELISPSNGWMAVNNSSDKKTVTVFPCDYDTYTEAINLEQGVLYYFTIPAGIVKNAEGTMNQNIVLAFNGKGTSSIESTTASSFRVSRSGDRFDVVLGHESCTAELFNANGILLERIENATGSISFSAENNGLYLIRITTDNESKTIKIIK